VHGEVRDFVDDRSNMPQGMRDVAVRKYRNRMLFFPTERCGGHCQYCFRQDVLSELTEKRETAALAIRLESLDAYLASTPDVDEVILSGGDPLVLSNGQLRQLLELISKHGRAVRIHTRMMMFAPGRIQDDLIDILAEHKARLVLHTVHPYELVPEVRSVLERLSRGRVRLYNQFPLLRNVNDHVAVLVRLLTELDELWVRNLSVFLPDPISYSASFRMTLARAFDLIDSLNLDQPSWINSTRLVLDTTYGKVRREHYVAAENHFVRRTDRVPYVDFPAELDVPGDVSRLLWKS
jgi:KamA family protein